MVNRERTYLHRKDLLRRCRFLSLRCRAPPTRKLGTRFEQTQHDAEGGFSRGVAIESSSVAAGEVEGEKQDGKATVNEQEI